MVNRDEYLLIKKTLSVSNNVSAASLQLYESAVGYKCAQRGERFFVLIENILSWKRRIL